MDFVFQKGRTIRPLIIDDDASHEGVAIETGQTISGKGVALDCWIRWRRRAACRR